MQNTSGILPCEFNVVIKPDPVEERTKGGLILTADTQEREKHAATEGTIIGMSPMAFNADVWDQSTPKPEPGDRCLIARHAGTFAKGKDGEEYRIVKDKDVVALLME